MANPKSSKARGSLRPELRRQEPRRQEASEFSGTQLGLRIKELRTARRLKLSECSETTGVSASYLSKMENGQVSPSFDIIKRLCDGLRISLEDLVRPGEKSQVSGRKTVTRREEGIGFASGQYDYKAHGTELSNKRMVPLELRVRARSVEEFDHWSRHAGEEFVYVLSGAIEIHTEHYAPFRLEAGESAYFDSSMEHLYVTTSREDARVLSVSHDPRPGAAKKLVDFLNPAARRVEEDLRPETATDAAA